MCDFRVVVVGWPMEVVQHKQETGWFHVGHAQVEALETDIAENDPGQWPRLFFNGGTANVKRPQRPCCKEVLFEHLCKPSCEQVVAAESQTLQSAFSRLHEQ
ncbi:hypothetical protein DFA_06814 [Cavenderia fasciculata]|uniref:Uncharacterized protein n=1 Tax=Cavenderia fasciculata TaxID=261658 RepID=F4Q2C7_CACFS|nr:uncharacterized protein DFA_06814 [Cavenderia fasciculata]EGG18147.1 hypothetical protein DFA_06814 [Cavenderia fasciculata]|eukprot:XP_004366188.1 hypothetical protein DFA_06814 [Cavenderia fasciculata]